jgi:hypothetical protein
MKKNYLLILTALFLFLLSTHSQIPVQNQQQRKLALVIGNGNYISSTLANPENDAIAMKTALQSVGFTVLEYENLNQSQMKRAMDDFGIKLKSYDVGLFFYAGHGIQTKGYNYLIPVDAKLESEQQVEYDCVQADRILALMEASGTKVNIIILDACRNNPFERSWTRSESGKGLAFMTAPSGTLIAYATSPGRTASDGSGKNGLYTSAILENITIPQNTIIQMFQNVGRIVSQKSNKQQVPWISSSLIADFYFRPESNVSAIDQGAISPNESIQKDAEDQAIILNPAVNEKNISKNNYPKINGPDDWQLVEVLEKKPDIAGLTEVKKIKATSIWGGINGSDMGLNNCIRDLKKKAAEINCPIVVLTDKKFGMSTSIEGIAYKVFTGN